MLSAALRALLREAAEAEESYARPRPSDRFRGEAHDMAEREALVARALRFRIVDLDQPAAPAPSPSPRDWSSM